MVQSTTFNYVCAQPWPYRTKLIWLRNHLRISKQAQYMLFPAETAKLALLLVDFCKSFAYRYLDPEFSDKKK